MKRPPRNRIPVTISILAGLGLALALAVPALAAYIGPNRTVTEAYEYWR